VFRGRQIELVRSPLVADDAVRHVEIGPVDFELEAPTPRQPVPQRRIGQFAPGVVDQQALDVDDRVLVPGAAAPTDASPAPARHCDRSLDD